MTETIIVTLFLSVVIGHLDGNDSIADTVPINQKSIKGRPKGSVH